MNNELTIVHKDIRMTSLDIAEITGKRHDHILRDIRQEIENIGDIAAPIFGVSEYRDSTGRSLPCYVFGRRGAMQLALKYDAKIRYKVILKIEELEELGRQLKPQLPDFTNPGEAARAWADQYERADKAEAQIELDRPKVNEYNRFIESDGNFTLRSAAKALGFGPNLFTRKLRDEGILSKVDNINIPKQLYVQQGYFVVRCRHAANNTRSFPQTFITPKGFTWLSGKFQNGTI